MVKSILLDYLTDGYTLLNKCYVDTITRDEDTIFVEEVLKANSKMDITESLSLPLDTKFLMEWFFENEIVFEINNKDESMCWIGKIEGTTEKSIFLTNFTPKGFWKDSYFTFRKKILGLFLLIQIISILY